MLLRGCRHPGAAAIRLQLPCGLTPATHAPQTRFTPLPVGTRSYAAGFRKPTLPAEVKDLPDLPEELEAIFGPTPHPEHFGPSAWKRTDVNNTM
jgi:hypothetical protein